MSHGDRDCSPVRLKRAEDGSYFYDGPGGRVFVTKHRVNAGIPGAGGAMTEWEVSVGDVTLTARSLGDARRFLGLIGSAPTPAADPALLAIANAARALPWTASSCDSSKVSWKGGRAIVRNCGKCPRCVLRDLVESFDRQHAGRDR